MRVVLDTNVLVSALLFRKGRLEWLRESWMAGRFTPLIDRACGDELLRVLTYPKFQLDRDDIEAVLGCYLPYAETVEQRRERRWVKKCRDAEDRKFLNLAESGGAEVLVTGDRSLRALAENAPFAIESPSRFRERLS